MTITLRPRQEVMVARSVVALNEHGNTLSVAPTGSGKTIMMAKILGQSITGSQRALVLQHRHELLEQNQSKFLAVNPTISTSLFRSVEKNTEGQTIFAMVQTLCRKRNLDLMPTIDVLAIDEAHHTMASSYLNIINALKEKNQNLKVLGLTATPSRGDRQKLLSIFRNVADQIYISELIVSGHLVPPKTFAIDLGYNTELRELFEKIGEQNLESEALMGKACVIMNTDGYCEEVVRNWRKYADTKPTVVFCTTIAHAKHIQEAFEGHGIKTAHVNGDMKPFERESQLKCFTTGEASVITNVAVLTEGWNHPPTSCIMICRPLSFKSTYIQMVGRGLRPSEEKDHCVVLDFGLSASIHGSLEQMIQDEPEQKKDDKSTQRRCPECKASIPLRSKECPLCGCNLQNLPPVEFGDFKNPIILKEMEVLEQSSYRWSHVSSDTVMAVGVKSYVLVKKNSDGTFSVFGGENHEENSAFLYRGTEQRCLYHGEAYIASRETPFSAPCKGHSWLARPPSYKQLQHLQGIDVKDRYHAAVLLTLKFNKSSIKSSIHASQ